MKYLMNTKTGSVDTEDNWRADAKSDGWNFDAAGLVEVVNIHGTYYHRDTAVHWMDDDIRESLHSHKDWSGEQEFADAYCDAHLAKFGEEFTIY